MTSFAPTRSPIPGAAAAISPSPHRLDANRRPPSGNEPSFDDIFQSEAATRRTDRSDARGARRDVDRRADRTTNSRVEDAKEPPVDHADETRQRRERSRTEQRDSRGESTEQLDASKRQHETTAAHAAAEPVAVDTSAAPASKGLMSPPESDVDASAHSASELHDVSPVDTLAADDVPSPGVEAVVADAGPSSAAETLENATSEATSTDPAASATGPETTEQLSDAAALSKQAARVASEQASGEPVVATTNQRPATPLEGSGPTSATTIGQTATSSDQTASPSTGLAAEQLRNTEMVRRSDLARLGATTRLGVDITTDELGAIRVEALERSGALHLTLSSDDGSTRQMLTERSRELRESLGGNLASFDVDQGTGDGRAQHEPPDRATASPAGTVVGHVTDPSVTTPAAVDTTIDGPLDLRL